MRTILSTFLRERLSRVPDPSPAFGGIAETGPRAEARMAVGGRR